MNKITDYIVGFRSKNKNHMIIASIYYIATLLLAISFKENSLFSVVLFWSVPFIVYAIKDAKNLKNYKSLIYIPVCLVLLTVSANLTPSKPEPEQILFNNKTLDFSDIEQEKEIAFTVQPENAKTDRIEIVIENPEIVSYKDGKLTSLQEGTTALYAECSSNNVKSDKIAITVIDKRKQEERQNKANEIMALIDKINEDDMLNQGYALNEANEAYNNADDKVKALVTNKEKLDTLNEKFKAAQEEERIRLEEEKKKAEEEEKARIATETAAAQSSSKSQGSSASNSSGGGTVYVGKTGNKYHRSGCPTLKGKGTAISLSQAIAEGRTACQRCH